MESITRARRLIQAEGKYLPTSQLVREKRGIKEAEYRIFINNNLEEIKVY